MSRNGVPSSMSTPRTCRRMPSRRRSSTTVRPIGFGRLGDRVANTPWGRLSPVSAPDSRPSQPRRAQAGRSCAGSAGGRRSRRPIRRSEAHAEQDREGAIADVLLEDELVLLVQRRKPFGPVFRLRRWRSEAGRSDSTAARSATICRRFARVESRTPHARCHTRRTRLSADWGVGKRFSLDAIPRAVVRFHPSGTLAVREDRSRQSQPLGSPKGLRYVHQISYVAQAFRPAIQRSSTCHRRKSAAAPTSCSRRRRSSR